MATLIEFEGKRPAIAAAYHVLRDRHLLTTATTQENP
jgi:hypothetical protein